MPRPLVQTIVIPPATNSFLSINQKIRASDAILVSRYSDQVVGRTSACGSACMADEALNSLLANSLIHVITQSARVAGVLAVAPPTNSIKCMRYISAVVHGTHADRSLARLEHRQHT